MLVTCRRKWLTYILAIPIYEVEADAEDGIEDTKCSQRVVDHRQWENNPIDLDSDWWMLVT